MSPDGQVFMVGYLLLLPLYLLPLWLTPILPGLDLPFHLSLAELLQRNAQEAPHTGVYEIRPRLSPYLLYYLLQMALAPALGVLLAHKLIMSLCIAALPLSGARLLSCCGRSCVPALLTFPLGYSMSFFYGFVSFCLSLPLLLLVLAQVADNLDESHDLDDNERILPALERDGLLLALTVLLFLCHLETFLFGVLAGLTLVVASDAPLVYRVRTALAFVPTLAALCWWRLVTLHDGPPGPALRQAVALLVRHRIADLGAPPSWEAVARDVLARLDAFPQHLMLGLSGGVHQVAAASLGAALLAFILLGTLGVLRRGGHHEPARLVGGGRAAMALAVMLYMALPHHLGELGITTVYPRFAVVIALLAPLMVPVWLKRLPRPVLALSALPALAACAWYGVELCRGFVRFGEEVADFRAVLDRAPPGQRAVGLVYDRQSRVLGIGSALVGLPHYYPLLRGGPKSLMAHPYCTLPYMPCRVKDAQQLPPDPGPFSPQKLDAARAVAYFDLFITRSPPSAAQIFGQHAAAVEHLEAAGSWVLYQRKASARSAASPPAAAPKEDGRGPDPVRGKTAERVRDKGDKGRDGHEREQRDPHSAPQQQDRRGKRRGKDQPSQR